MCWTWLSKCTADTGISLVGWEERGAFHNFIMKSQSLIGFSSCFGILTYFSSALFSFSFVSSLGEVWKWKSESEVTQSCLTLCNPMDCSLPRSSVHGVFQARVLEWVAISFSRGSSWPRDRTRVSHIIGRHCTIWANWEVCRWDKKALKGLEEESPSSNFCKALVKSFHLESKSYSWRSR